MITQKAPLGIRQYRRMQQVKFSPGERAGLCSDKTFHFSFLSVLTSSNSSSAGRSPQSPSLQCAHPGPGCQFTVRVCSLKHGGAEAEGPHSSWGDGRMHDATLGVVQTSLPPGPRASGGLVPFRAPSLHTQLRKHMMPYRISPHSSTLRCPWLELVWTRVLFELLAVVESCYLDLRVGSGPGVPGLCILEALVQRRAIASREGRPPPPPSSASASLAGWLEVSAGWRVESTAI